MPRRFSVYQLGRGSAPVVVVSSAFSLVAVNIEFPPNPACGERRCRLTDEKRRASDDLAAFDARMHRFGLRPWLDVGDDRPDLAARHQIEGLQDLAARDVAAAEQRLLLIR